MSDERPSLKRSSITSLASNLAGSGLRLLLQIVLARELGSTGYGRFVLGRSWGEIIAKLPNRGYQTGAPRVLPEYELGRRHGEFMGFVRAALVDTTIAGTSLSALAIGLYLLLTDHPDHAIVAGFLLVVPLSLAWMCRALLQGHHRYATGSVLIEVVQPVVFAVAVGTLLATDHLTAVNALLAWIGAFALVTVIEYAAFVRGLPHEVRSATRRTSRPEWRRLGRTLFVSHVAAIVLEQGDLVIAGAMLGPADLAAYAIAGRLAILGRMINAGVQPVTSSHLSAAAAAGDWQESQRIIDRSLRLVAPPTVALTIIAAVFADPLIRLFGDDYDGAVALLRIFLIGNLVDGLTGPAMWVVPMSGLERIYSRVMTGFAALLLVATPAGVAVGGAVGAACVATAVTAGWNLTLVTVARRRLGLRCYVRPTTLRRS